MKQNRSAGTWEGLKFAEPFASEGLAAEELST